MPSTMAGRTMSMHPLRGCAVRAQLRPRALRPPPRSEVAAGRMIRNDRVVVLRGDASETDGLPHKHRDAFGLHLLHDFGAIAFDRPHTDTQLGGDGVTGEAFRDKVEDFDLSRCQSREIPAEALLRLLQMLPL